MVRLFDVECSTPYPRAASLIVRRPSSRACISTATRGDCRLPSPPLPPTFSFFLHSLAIYVPCISLVRCPGCCCVVRSRRLSSLFSLFLPSYTECRAYSSSCTFTILSVLQQLSAPTRSLFPLLSSVLQASLSLCAGVFAPLLAPPPPQRHHSCASQPDYIYRPLAVPPQKHWSCASPSTAQGAIM